MYTPLLLLTGCADITSIEDGAVYGDVEVIADWFTAYRIGTTLLLGDAALINGDGALVPVPEKRSEDPEGAEDALTALAQTLAARPDDVAHLVPSHSGGSSAVTLLWSWLPDAP